MLWEKRSFIGRFVPCVVCVLISLSGCQTGVTPKAIPTAPKNQAPIVVDAAVLTSDYLANEAAANDKYLNHLLEVTGPVALIEDKGQYVCRVWIKDTQDPALSRAFEAIVCEMDPRERAAMKQLVKGQSVAIVGKCDGMNTHIILSNCHLK